MNSITETAKGSKMISIIIPVYNVEPYLTRCVDSVLSQTYRDIEVILVDDGSPDHCGAICDSYAEKDPRIKVIHKVNGGLSDARNAGIDIAAGEYLGFVDSDDYVHPQMYEILLNNLLQTDSNLSVCQFFWIDEQESPGQPGDNLYQIFEGEDLLRQLNANNTDSVIACNKLYKRELFDNNRFEYGRLHEDEFMAHKILYKAQKAVYSTSKLYVYVKREGSIVNTAGIKRMIDTLDAFEERRLFFKGKSEYLYWSTCHEELYLIKKYYSKFGKNRSLKKKYGRLFLNLVGLIIARKFVRTINHLRIM